MSMSDLSLTDLNTYAAQALDREHVSQLGVFFNDRKLVSYDRDDKRIEKWTIDPQRAFNIGYDLVFLPRLTEICIQQAKKVRLKVHHPVLRIFSQNRGSFCEA